MLWQYDDQDGRHIFTEEEILEIYYPHWKREMTRIGKVDQISERACIEDWVVVNWAWKVEE